MTIELLDILVRWNKHFLPNKCNLLDIAEHRVIEASMNALTVTISKTTCLLYHLVSVSAYIEKMEKEEFSVNDCTRQFRR